MNDTRFLVDHLLPVRQRPHHAHGHPARPEAGGAGSGGDGLTPTPVRRDTDYASLVQSDMPIVVQHTRLDSRQAENVLITTVVYPCRD
jgi:hypothetical protein